MGFPRQEYCSGLPFPPPDCKEIFEYISLALFLSHTHTHTHIHTELYWDKFIYCKICLFEMFDSLVLRIVTGVKSSSLSNFEHFHHLEKESLSPELPWQLSGRDSTYQHRRRSFDPWVGKIPCRRKSAGKESACNAGDLGSIPGLEWSPGEGNGYPLQYSCWENPTNCIVHGMAKSWTWLSDFHFPVSFPGKSHRLRSLAGCSPSSDQRAGCGLATKQQQTPPPLTAIPLPCSWPPLVYFLSL